MEDLIKQAFLHVDVIGPHVQAGHYDLVGPNGEIILPQIWDKVIEPDWSVTMHMWPMDRPGPAGHMAGRGGPILPGLAARGGMPFIPGRGHPAGAARGPGGPPGSNPGPGMGMRMGMGGMGGMGGMRPSNEMPANIVNATKPSKKATKGQKGVLKWVVGGNTPKGGRK